MESSGSGLTSHLEEKHGCVNLDRNDLKIGNKGKLISSGDRFTWIKRSEKLNTSKNKVNSEKGLPWNKEKCDKVDFTHLRDRVSGLRTTLELM